MKHLLARNARLEDDVVDQLQSTCEQRLARTLLLLARDDRRGTPKTIVRSISQMTLASIVGGTRSWINHFLQKSR
jgi:CRP/FNR family transcriptional regulator, cyclic AMP receptor protein